nr:MFS transporter [Mesorhizobium sp.]
MVALVQASSNLPAFILSLFAGALADNFSRRRVMFAGRCLMVMASAMLTAFVALGFVGPWMILGFSFQIACGGALNDPAWQASVGDIVDRRDVPAAVTLLSVGFNTVRTVGPALGGIRGSLVWAFGSLYRDHPHLSGPSCHHMALQVEGSLLPSSTRVDEDGDL